MIDGIRRRFTRSIEKDPWSTVQEFEPAVEEASGLQTDTAVLLAAAQTTSGFYPGDVDPADYYISIVKTAIGNGGRYGDHQIPVPWLRMILAGLESRYVEADALWYEADAESPVNRIPEIPPYEDLFPSSRDAPVNLR
jgi:hypothetical protein